MFLAAAWFVWRPERKSNAGNVKLSLAVPPLWPVATEMPVYSESGLPALPDGSVRMQ